MTFPDLASSIFLPDSALSSIRIPTFASPTQHPPHEVIPATREEARLARLRGPTAQWANFRALLNSPNLNVFLRGGDGAGPSGTTLSAAHVKEGKSLAEVGGKRGEKTRASGKRGKATARISVASCSGLATDGKGKAKAVTRRAITKLAGFHSPMPYSPPKAAKASPTKWSSARPSAPTLSEAKSKQSRKAQADASNTSEALHAVAVLSPINIPAATIRAKALDARTVEAARETMSRRQTRSALTKVITDMNGDESKRGGDATPKPRAKRAGKTTQLERTEKRQRRSAPPSISPTSPALPVPAAVHHPKSEETDAFSTAKIPTKRRQKYNTIGSENASERRLTASGMKPLPVAKTYTLPSKSLESFAEPDSSLKLEAQRASLDAIRNSVAQLAAELLEMQHARAKLRINAADRQQEVKEDQKPKPIISKRQAAVNAPQAADTGLILARIAQVNRKLEKLGR